MAFVSRCMATIRWIEATSLCLLLFGMTGLYALNVGVRGLIPAYAAQIAWIDELTRFMLIWLVFLSIPQALERGMHVSMSVVQARMPTRLRWATMKLVDLIGIAVCAYFVYLAWVLTAFVARTGQISPTLGISVVWLYAVVPVGLGLMTLRFLLDLIGLADRSAAAVARVTEPEVRETPSS